MKNTINLSAEQHEIYVHIMKHGSASPQASLKNCTIPGAVSDQHLVAYAPLKQPKEESDQLDSTPKHLVTSLPLISNQVYILVVDETPEQFCSLVAHLDAESESNDALCEGHISLMPDKTLSALGWHGVAILPITTVFSQFPPKSILGEDSFDFHLILLLNKEEYHYAFQHKTTQLLAQLTEQNRSLCLASPPTISLPPDSQQDDQKLAAEPSQPAAPSEKSARKRPSKPKTKAQRAPQKPSTEQPREPKQSEPNLPPEPSTQKHPHPPRLRTKGESHQEKREHMVELILGCILSLIGLLIGFIFTRTSFPGSVFFPIAFASIGIIMLFSAIRDGRNSQ